MPDTSRPIDGTALAVLFVLLFVGGASVFGSGFVGATFSDQESIGVSVSAGDGPHIDLNLRVRDLGKGNAHLRFNWTTNADSEVLGGGVEVTDDDGTVVFSRLLNGSEALSGSEKVVLHENGTYTVTITFYTAGFDSAVTQSVLVDIPAQSGGSDDGTSSSSTDTATQTGTATATETGTSTSTETDTSTQTERATQTRTTTETETQTETQTQRRTPTATETETPTATESTETSGESN